MSTLGLSSGVFVGLSPGNSNPVSGTPLVLVLTEHVADWSDDHITYPANSVKLIFVFTGFFRKSLELLPRFLAYAL